MAVASAITRQSFVHLLTLLMCLIISGLPASSYKSGEFPGLGTRQAWQKSNSSFLDGTRFGEAGKFDQAIEKLQGAIAVYEFDPRYFYNLGMCFEGRDKAGDMSRAEIAYRRATQLNPDNWKYWNGLANPLFRQRKYSEAKSALLEALDKGAPSDAVPVIKESLKDIEQAARSVKKK